MGARDAIDLIFTSIAFVVLFILQFSVVLMAVIFWSAVGVCLVATVIMALVSLVGGS